MDAGGDGFAEVLAATIKHEGGWKLHRDSNGAMCYAGVNQRANPEWGGWALLPDTAPSRPRTIDSDELRALVGEVYRAQYWDCRVCRFCAPWPVLRAQVFDCAVNHGFKGAALRLQEACRLDGSTIDADGAMGPATEDAVAALVDHLGETGANNTLVDARVDFYGRMARNKGHGRYLKGWTRRAETYRVRRRRPSKAN